jgi:hypothetical protein
MALPTLFSHTQNVGGLQPHLFGHFHHAGEQPGRRMFFRLKPVSNVNTSP